MILIFLWSGNYKSFSWTQRVKGSGSLGKPSFACWVFTSIQPLISLQCWIQFFFKRQTRQFEHSAGLSFPSDLRLYIGMPQSFWTPIVDVHWCVNNKHQSDRENSGAELKHGQKPKRSSRASDIKVTGRLIVCCCVWTQRRRITQLWVFLGRKWLCLCLLWKCHNFTLE